MRAPPATSSYSSLAAMLLLASSSARAAGNLEPADGQMLVGAWYDRPNDATPKQINARLAAAAPNGLAFFQTDIDLTGVVKPITGPNITDQFLQQLQDTSSDAAAFLTLYPFNGYDQFTDAQLADITTRIQKIVNAGRSVFIRYAPEMNGSWFSYGQNPAAFIASWKRFVSYVRKTLGDSASKVAFVWSPNSGNGYPYPNGISSPVADGVDGSANSTRIKAMDSNGNGVLDSDDDPYLPFYPGDEWVDWAGISIYHYGIQWPWIDNVVPEANKFEGYLQGNVKPDWGTKPFYTYFGGGGNVNSTKVSAGNKPIFISETAATYHYGWSQAGLDAGKTNAQLPPGTASMLDVKQGWWRSYLNADFLQKYPRIKAVCAFEFVKDEELTKRDFSIFGTAPMGLTDDGAVADAWIADVKQLSFVKFASGASAAPTSASSGSGGGSSATTSASVGATPTGTGKNGGSGATSAFTEGVSGVVATVIGAIIAFIGIF